MHSSSFAGTETVCMNENDKYEYDLRVQRYINIEVLYCCDIVCNIRLHGTWLSKSFFLWSIIVWQLTEFSVSKSTQIT